MLQAVRFVLHAHRVATRRGESRGGQQPPSTEGGGLLEGESVMTEVLLTTHDEKPGEMQRLRCIASARRDLEPPWAPPHTPPGWGPEHVEKLLTTTA